MTRINMKKSFNFGMCPSKLLTEKRTNAPEKAFECGKSMIPSTNPHARPLKGLHKGPFFSRMMFGAGHFSQSQCWCFRDKMRWCFVFWPQPLHDLMNWLSYSFYTHDMNHTSTWYISPSCGQCALYHGHPESHPRRKS